MRKKYIRRRAEGRGFELEKSAGGCLPCDKNRVMYSAVPPPGLAQTSVSTPKNEAKVEEPPAKPRHVHEHQWKTFCELRARREKEVSSGTAKRAEAARNKTLKSVSQKLSKEDKDILREEGVSLPRIGRKKQRLRESEGEREGEGEGKKEKAEAEWHEVRSLMEPNPQLKGVDVGKYAPKSFLEEEMDECIERGKFEEAVEMSEKMAQREFSSKVATAFECREYIKRKKIEDERKRKRKPPKLDWRFEPKRPWETKGNM